MTLSTKTRRRLEVAMASKPLAKELLDDLAARAEKSALETTAPVTLWVDATNGLDTNDGSEAAPLKTWVAAINLIPRFVNHAITIHFKRGAYQTSVITCVLNAGITIVGDDYDTPTLVGPTAGTITSMVTNNAQVPAASWAVNELKGKFVKILTAPSSTSDVGETFPIASNTATSFELAGKPNWANATFVIVEPAAELIASSATANVQLNAAGGSALTLKNFKLSATTAYYSCYTTNTAALVVRNCFIGATSYYGAYAYKGAALFIYHSYISASGYAGIYQSLNTHVAVGDVIIDSGKKGVQCESSTVFTPQILTNWGIIVSNMTDEGLWFNAGIRYVYTNFFIVRNCKVGIQLFNSLSMEVDDGIIESCTEDGLRFGAGGDDDGCTVVGLSGCTIRNCGRDGIRIYGKNQHVQLTSCTITGHTGYAVNFAPGNQFCFNGLTFNAATTFGGTLGEICANTGVVKTEADINGAADKVYVDQVRLNRIAQF